MKQNIIILGASGHAKVIIDIIEKENVYNILGVIDVSMNVGDVFFGYPVLGHDDDLPDLMVRNKGCKLFIAIGDNWRRAEVYRRITASIPDADFASVLHPSAQIGRDVAIGKGVAVMAGAVINSGTSIGDFVIINTRSGIDHDNKIQSFSSFAPGAISGGNVSVGEYSAIAIGAVILHGISIGCHTIIGASSLVTGHVEDYRVAWGTPAKVVRARKPGDSYL